MQDEEDGASFSIPHAMLTNNTVETIPLLDAATSPSPGNEESLKRPSPSSVGGGRMVSNVWGWFTDETEPQKKKSAICKHCQQRVNHHRKSEMARAHMNGCAGFRSVMNGLEHSYRPDWYVANKKGGGKNQNYASKIMSSPDGTSTGTYSRQTSIRAYALPAMSQYEKKQFQTQIAMHYYATGTSFQRVEDVHLRAAIKLLRPDSNVLPNRKQLAGVLLENCHKDLQSKVNERMMGATSCLTSDAWTNIKNDSVMNYMAVSPDCSLFLESVSTGQQGHNHQFIAQDISRVIHHYTSTSFAGAVTDNTSTNKKAWTLLKKEFPSCYFQGCCAHGLHLLVKDVFAATKTKKNGEQVATYPINYPFERMLVFIDECKEVVKFFHNHHIPKAQLQELQLTTGAPGLVRPAPTRWGTIQKMCATLLASERHLFAIVTARDFAAKGSSAQKAERKRVKEVVSDDNFVENLKKALKILVPIDRLIVKYQSDKVPVSEVLPDFHSLPGEFETFHAANLLTDGECQYLVMLAAKRFQFMFGVAHGLSYMLDPCFLGQHLPSTGVAARLNLENTLFETPEDDTTPCNDARRELLYTQYTKFFIAASAQKNQNSFCYQVLKKGSKTPLEYWLVDGCEWKDLQKIAIKLFSMATSSAASERNFSTMGFIHSKLRNGLSPKTVEKLVFIKSNMAAFYDVTSRTDEPYELCDTDNEQDEEPLENDNNSSDSEKDVGEIDQ